MSGCIPHLSSLHSPVFLLTICLDLFYAPRSSRGPFIPDGLGQFAWLLNQESLNALVCSTRPRGSVCGTGAAWVKLSGFSREYDYPHCQIPPKRTPYCQVQPQGWICLPLPTPTLCNGDRRRPAVVSLLRLHVAPCGSDGILTVSAIAIAVRLRLRTRLTPG